MTLSGFGLAASNGLHARTGNCTADAVPWRAFAELGGACPVSCAGTFETNQGAQHPQTAVFQDGWFIFGATEGNWSRRALAGVYTKI